MTTQGYPQQLWRLYYECYEGNINSYISLINQGEFTIGNNTYHSIQFAAETYYILKEHVNSKNIDDNDYDILNNNLSEITTLFINEINNNEILKKYLEEDANSETYFENTEIMELLNINI